MNEVGKDLTPQQVVAYTIWGEARGESLSGKMAVACCIFTRAFLTMRYQSNGEAKAQDFLKDVCLVPHQFSCWKDGVFQQESPCSSGYASVWFSCRTIADEPFNSDFVPLLQATHYFALTIPAPSWAANMDFVGKFGNQLFYNDKNWRG